MLPKAPAGAVLLLALGSAGCGARDTVERRVDERLSQMTLEEKIAQLQCEDRNPLRERVLPPQGLGALKDPYRSQRAAEAAQSSRQLQAFVRKNTRLGIPILVHEEGVHGLVTQDATMFPQATALAATFDPGLVERIARAVAAEARARGIRQVLAPVVNVAQDPRWGRVQETFGEDTLLASRMGVAFCRGLEGGGVIATPKHFLANYGEGGRDSNPVTLSERTLREIFLPPFEACFREGGATSVMTALNSIDGVPCSTNRWLLGRVLRGEWGFRGFVVSDYGALPGVLEHGTAASLEEVAAQALLAGVDMELQSKEVYGPPLVQALQEHRVSRASLDAAVRRVLRVKAFHGLLDGAGDTAPAPPPETVGCAEHHALALQAAREGLVLLKNDGLLPLSPARYRIAVLGAAAAAPVLGSYSFTNGPVVTMLQGIRARAGAPVTYAPGCGVGTLEPFDPLPEVLLSTPGARRARGVRAEYFETHIDGPVLLSRTERSISLDPGHPALTPELHAKLAAIRWSARFESPASGTYMLIVRYEGGGVRVWLDGQLLKDAAPPPSHGGAEFVPMHLEAHRSYSLGVEFFRSEGESQLELLCDLPNARRLAEAAAAARAADVAIVVVASLEGEGWDRSSLDLPGAQEPLIQAVAATGTPTAVVVLAGAPITMRSWLNAARAVVLPWYPGDQGGTAVAEALFGDFSPAGRLSIGFPKTVGQAPLPYRAAPSGRSFSYLDADGPQFAFGFGLGYTRFEYDGLRIEPAVIPPSGSAVVHVTVKNVGARAGDEVVQLYVRQQVASVVRPLLELKGFERVTLQPGEAREVTFRLGPAELSLLDRNLRRVVEPGHFTVMVGAASSDIRVRGELTVRE